MFQNLLNMSNMAIATATSYLGRAYYLRQWVLLHLARRNYKLYLAV